MHRPVVGLGQPGQLRRDRRASPETAIEPSFTCIAGAGNATVKRGIAYLSRRRLRRSTARRPVGRPQRCGSPCTSQLCSRWHCSRSSWSGWRPRPLEQIAARAMDAPPDAARIARAAPGTLSEQAVLDLAIATQSSRNDAIENALADYEFRIQRRLDRTRMLVRAGPALGLMGTLIPV